MKRIRNVIIFITIAAFGWWLLGRFNILHSFSNIFTPKPVTIQNTPVVVEQVRALAQLVTITAYEELVADTSFTEVKTINLPLLPNIELARPKRKLVMVGKATTHIGIDMQKLGNTDISGTTDSIHILLPPAEIFDVIINPSNTDIFVEEGEWNNVAVANLKNKMQYLAAANVKSRGLLAQSEKKAVELLTNFFKAAGYAQVVIQFTGGKTKFE